MRGRSSTCWATASARCGSPGRSTRSARGAASLRWMGAGVPASGTAGTIWDTLEPMARRRPITQEKPDAVREAVHRTVQATIGSAQQGRGRAQDAVDELVRTAEAGAGAVRERVRGALGDRRPATSEDLRELRRELEKIGRRLGALERRLDADADAGGAKGAGAKRGSGRPAL